jgi:hypothetical protein
MPTLPVAKMMDCATKPSKRRRRTRRCITTAKDYPRDRSPILIRQRSEQTSALSQPEGDRAEAGEHKRKRNG